jgi:hypothetical protein|tara:strand:+ start:1064 stop:1258 length:195 start_codon:yes stop_codon:yes gene_type:complete
MKKLNLFGIQFIVRVRVAKSNWSIKRLDQSVRVELGRLVIYKMDRNTFNGMNGIVDRQGQVTIA